MSRLGKTGRHVGVLFNFCDVTYVKEERDIEKNEVSNYGKETKYDDMERINRDRT